MQRRTVALWRLEVASLLAAISTMGICGCQTHPPEVLTNVRSALPISGRVYLDGQPLKKGTVCFMPEDGDGTTASGKIEDDGSFVMGTCAPKDGVLAGRYRVAVISWESPPTRPDGVGKPQIPEKYFDSEQSGIPAVVVPMASKDELRIDLKSK